MYFMNRKTGSFKMTKSPGDLKSIKFIEKTFYN